MQKLNTTLCTINGSAVWGRLSEKYLTQNVLHEIFVIYSNLMCKNTWLPLRITAGAISTVTCTYLLISINALCLLAAS